MRFEGSVEVERRPGENTSKIYSLEIVDKTTTLRKKTQTTVNY
jgi:hypothetical protein